MVVVSRYLVGGVLLVLVVDSVVPRVGLVQTYLVVVGAAVVVVVVGAVYLA